MPHLAGTLQVDLEDHRTPFAQRALNGLARRTVAVAMHTGPLQEPAGGDQLVELGVVKEVVRHPIDFTRTRFARGGGTGNEDLGMNSAQPLDDGPLTDGRRAGDHIDARAEPLRTIRPWDSLG